MVNWDINDAWLFDSYIFLKKNVKVTLLPALANFLSLWFFISSPIYDKGKNLPHFLNFIQHYFILNLFRRLWLETAKSRNVSNIRNTKMHFGKCEKKKKNLAFFQTKNLSAFNLKGTLFVLPKFEEKLVNFHLASCSLILIFLHSFSFFARFLHKVQKPICHSFPY